MNNTRINIQQQTFLKPLKICGGAILLGTTLQRIMISESSTMHADRATVKINSQPNFHKERKFLGKGTRKEEGKV